MKAEKDYVLGTHDEEIERLGIQHRVWRPRVLDAWRRAGITVGQSLLDVGAGPGYAAMDLAEIVGANGKVTAIDRSRRFLDALAVLSSARRLANIETHEIDLEMGALPDGRFDGAWCRWVLTFLADPRRIVDELARVIRPGGVFVSHEYFAYETWKMLPPSAEHDDFVRAVLEGWRAAGGDPNIGLRLPAWLTESGFDVVEARAIVEVVRPGDFTWQWPKSFIASGAQRYAELGVLTPVRAAEIMQAFERAERTPNAMMITPAVLEIVARRV